MNNEETTPTPQKPTTPEPKPMASAGAPKKVFDVMRPGKAPASPTSRPVIVGHKPQVKDDQFVPSADSRFATDNPFDKHSLMSHSKVEVKPDESAALTDDTAKLEGEQGSAESTAATPLPMPTAEEPEPPKEDNASTVPAKPDADVMDGVDELTKAAAYASQATQEIGKEAVDASSQPDQPAPLVPSPENTKNEQAEELVPNAPEPEDTTTSAEVPVAPAPPAPANAIPEPTPATNPDTAESHQGKVLNQEDVLAETSAPVLDHAVISHHGKTKTKWWEWVLILLIVIVLVAIALNFLLDAGVIKTSLNIPHTNLIKN